MKEVDPMDHPSDKETLESLGYHDPTLGPAPPSDMSGLMEEMIFHKRFDFRWAYDIPSGKYNCTMMKTYRDRIDAVSYLGKLDEEFLKWIEEAMWALNKKEV